MVNTYPELAFGYTVIWGILTLYIFYLGFKISKLENKKDNND